MRGEKDYKGKPNFPSTFKIPAFVISAIFFYQIKLYGQMKYQWAEEIYTAHSHEKFFKVT